MATPFATASDLAARLKVPMWDGEALEQVESFLDDASNDLRGEIGWQVYPPAGVTVDVTPDWAGRVQLPGFPVAEIVAVTQSGADLTPDQYEWSGGLLQLGSVDAASVTYTVGYSYPPLDLLRWTCVIAAGMLAAAADDSLGGTPSSMALGDWRVSYSERQQQGEIPVPPRVLERLRSTYGQSVFAT